MKPYKEPCGSVPFLNGHYISLFGCQNNTQSNSDMFYAQLQTKLEQYKQNRSIAHREINCCCYGSSSSSWMHGFENPLKKY